MENELKKILKEFYEELSKLEKPKTTKIGGTYYGRTQLFSHVGNMLDFEDGVTHISYDYGSSTIYQNACIIRIGGAYRREYDVSTKEIVEKLKKVIGGKYYLPEKKLGIIDTYGTNFSVVGFGYLG